MLFQPYEFFKSIQVSLLLYINIIALLLLTKLLVYWVKDIIIITISIIYEFVRKYFAMKFITDIFNAWKEHAVRFTTDVIMF